jgi:hypothetical protein
MRLFVYICFLCVFVHINSQWHVWRVILYVIPGPRLNGQTLLSFSHSLENDADARIKSAMLWVRMELRPGVLRGALTGAGPVQCHHHHHAPRHKNFSFYVFRANAMSASSNTTYFSGKVCWCTNDFLPDHISLLYTGSIYIAHSLLMCAPCL